MCSKNIDSTKLCKLQQLPSRRYKHTFEFKELDLVRDPEDNCHDL